MSNACCFCLQAAPAAEDAKAAEAAEPNPETKETGEAKADAVEEVKETAEDSYWSTVRHVDLHLAAASDCVGDLVKLGERHRNCILLLRSCS